MQESGSGELHELVLLRRNDDVDESFEEILAKGEAALADVTPTGFAFVPPVDGARDLIVADLEPGAYLAICFLPQNSSSSGDGPPHFVLGMQQEITVE